MTLPGIAGFVLTMGIGVDSNVLIFERIKEELAAQRGVRAAINAGFGRVFLTLLDTHIASLISAVFLFQFGTGPIRGFATDAVDRALLNLFTSIFVSKTLFEFELSQRQNAARSASRLDHAYFQESELRLRPLEVARDRPVVARHPRRRARDLDRRGMPLGVEFSGGTIVILQFDQQPPDSTRSARRSTATAGRRAERRRPALRRPRSTR